MQSYPGGRGSFTRRTFLRGAAALAAVPVLSACGGAATKSAGTKLSGTVTTWVYPLAGTDQAKNEAAWKEIIKGFNEKYPDVKVDVQVLPWANRNDKLTTALAANAGPDVAYLNEDFVPQHAGDGNLEPLDTLLSDDKGDYLPNALTTATFDGKLYIAPILMTATTLIYNSKLFKDVGVDTFPTNWDELLQVAPKFKEKSLFVTDYPGALEQSLNLTYYPLLWQAGGDVLTEDGKKAAFNSPEGLAALNFVKTLFDKEYTNKSASLVVAEQGRSQLETSKAGVGLVVGNDAFAALNTAWGAGALKLGAPMKNKKQVSYGTVAGWGLFKQSKNKDAAGAWIKYMITPDVMKKILAMGSYFAPRKSIGSLYGSDPNLGELEKYLPMMHGGVRHRAARPIIGALAPEIQAAFLGKKSPEQALADAEKEVNKLLQ